MQTKHKPDPYPPHLHCRCRYITRNSCTQLTCHRLYTARAQAGPKIAKTDSPSASVLSQVLILVAMTSMPIMRPTERRRPPTDMTVRPRSKAERLFHQFEFLKTAAGIIACTQPRIAYTHAPPALGIILARASRSRIVYIGGGSLFCSPCG